MDLAVLRQHAALSHYDFPTDALPTRAVESDQFLPTPARRSPGSPKRWAASGIPSPPLGRLPHPQAGDAGLLRMRVFSRMPLLSCSSLDRQSGVGCRSTRRPVRFHYRGVTEKSPAWAKDRWVQSLGAGAPRPVSSPWTHRKTWSGGNVTVNLRWSLDVSPRGKARRSSRACACFPPVSAA